MPQPLRFARCCYTAVIAPDGAALPQSSHRAVLLCTVIALCGAALPQPLRFALCCYTTVIASCGAGSAYATVIASCGAGSLCLGNRVVRYRVVGGAGLMCLEVQQQQT